MKEQQQQKTVVSKPIHANKNAWIENRKWSLFQKLQTYDWIFFPGVSSRPIFFRREIKNTRFRRSSSPLKVSRNREICFPFFF